MNTNLSSHGKRGRLGLVVSAALVACLSATVDVPEVAVARENLSFPGVPDGTAVSDDIPADVRERYGLPAPGEAYHFPPITFSYERVPMDMPTGTSTDLHVKAVTIRAHEGSPSLLFVRGLRLTVAKPTEPGTAPVVLLEYPEPGASPEPIDRSLTLAFKGAWSPIDPWKADASVYTLDLWAVLEQLPRQDWALDVELVLSGSLDFEF
jgi:hypothetical protein